MKKKWYFIWAFIAIVVVAGGTGTYMFFKPHKDFGTSNPDITLTAADLYKQFDQNEAQANKRFVADDKTILVSGTIAEIVKNQDGSHTVIFDIAGSAGSVSCSLMPDQSAQTDTFKKGDKISIKGQCTGIQELIDKQVILIRCAIAG
jgi:hypothetical protein